MRRREFIAGLGGAVAWPLAAHAQRPAMPVIGYLSSVSANTTTSLVPFLEGLRDSGFVEGQNASIEYRWADGQYDRLPAMAADLVNHRVAVISTSGGVVTPRAAKAATATIPIVFCMGADPVLSGVVASLSRPGGNITGVTVLTGELSGKRLALLHELVPTAETAGYLWNPTNAGSSEKYAVEVARAVADLIRRRPAAILATQNNSAL